MAPFDDAVALESDAQGRLIWEVPDGWQQGRGAWGGLVVGALARAVIACEPDSERLLRSVSAHLVAPTLVGRHVIEVVEVRRGSAVSTWAATLRDGEGQNVARLDAVLGRTRRLDPEPPYATWQMVEPPAAPAANQVPSIDLPSVGGPVFMGHLDMRPISGIPGGNGTAETSGWVGYRDPARMDAAALMALVDGWWPAGLAALSAMRPIATVSFAANLVLDPADLPPGPLLHHAFVSAADEGFTSEVRRLWTADGRLVVDNLQSIVLIS